MNKPRILVVDDEDFIINLLTSGLTEYGFDVTTARSGFEALQKVDQEKPSLIISDIMMPKLSGLDLLKALKNNPKTRAIPFILVSAVDKTDTIVEGLDLGADDYITKPFKMNEIVGKVRHLLKSA